jgi:membrane protein
MTAQTPPEAPMGASIAERAPALVGVGVPLVSLFQVFFRHWKPLLRSTVHEMVSDRISLASAGVAFYAVLALFPAISMLISIYGLVFNPASVEPQLQVLRGFLPPAGFTLIADRVHFLVTEQRGLGIGLVISTFVTLWSSATGTKSLLSALNLAFDQPETRGLLVFQMVGFAMTLAAIIGAALGIALLVVLPAGLALLEHANSQWLVQALSLLGLVAYVMVALAVLYRLGPARPPSHWAWLTPGSMLATLLWLLASFLFSSYVGHVASYDATYGPLGAVAGVMMWFWVSAFVVLLGAELNAALERQILQGDASRRAGPRDASADRGEAGQQAAGPTALRPPPPEHRHPDRHRDRPG